MRKFARGQRVKVARDASAREIDAIGVVVRVRMADDAAWIQLDQRHSHDAVHPFPENDERGRNILAWPDDCELVQ